jgi:hypothetical protein
MLATPAQRVGVVKVRYQPLNGPDLLPAKAKEKFRATTGLKLRGGRIDESDRAGPNAFCKFRAVDRNATSPKQLADFLEASPKLASTLPAGKQRMPRPSNSHGTTYPRSPCRGFSSYRSKGSPTRDREVPAANLGSSSDTGGVQRHIVSLMRSRSPGGRAEIQKWSQRGLAHGISV